MAAVDDNVCGYVDLRAPTLLPTNRHFAMLELAVRPRFNGKAWQQELIAARPMVLAETITKQQVGGKVTNYI